MAQSVPRMCESEVLDFIKPVSLLLVMKQKQRINKNNLRNFSKKEFF